MYMYTLQQLSVSGLLFQKIWLALIRAVRFNENSKFSYWVILSHVEVDVVHDQSMAMSILRHKLVQVARQHLSGGSSHLF